MRAMLATPAAHRFQSRVSETRRRTSATVTTPTAAPSVFAMASDTVGYRVGSPICTTSIRMLVAVPAATTLHACSAGQAAETSAPIGTNSATFAMNSSIG